MRHINSFILILLVLFTAVGCGDSKNDYDATGLFEATEVVVSAEQNGRLLTFNAKEGSRLALGEQVGIIDTVQLWLKARQMGATRNVYAAQRPDLQKQVASTRQQLAKAKEDQARYAALVKDGAANRKLLDDAASQVRVLSRQLEAQLSTLNNSTQSLNAQMGTADLQRAQVLDQLAKCHIQAPIAGTVLETYAEEGEFATVGKPLFKMADTDNMYLRAYVTSAQLSKVRIGQQVQVFADFGDDNRRTYKGRVTWISDRGEFTPKTILTDDERADQVYAVKIALRNDGYVKIGMYGEVKF